jgi:PPP family 3-phenylpropionic acid transporter
MQRFPYWRLSSFYFTYYLFVGAFVPYWGLYLKSVNFSAVEIGILLSLFQVSRIFSPSFWGWLADRTNRRVAWIKLTALLGLLGYIGVFFGTSFVWLFFVMAALSIFTS